MRMRGRKRVEGEGWRGRQRWWWWRRKRRKGAYLGVFLSLEGFFGERIGGDWGRKIRDE